MESDLKLDLAAFQTESIDPTTLELNNTIDELCKSDVKWWQCGVDEYRRRRAAGETPFPPPSTLPNASHLEIPSPDGHVIKGRIFGEDLPAPKGLYYHIHGGGYVLGSAASQDLLLDEISRRTELVVVSIDYRLAPGHPYPAARIDCCMAAEWLLEHSQDKWGCSVKMIGGESAGATLAVLVLLHLRDTFRDNTICGAVLNYGQYDLSSLPTLRSLDPANSTLLSWEDCEQFSTAYLPGMSCEEKKQPRLSPAYNNLESLTSAIFIVGTADGVLDDTLLMAAKWQIAGNDAMVKFIPGACHGFMTFDALKVKVTRQGLDIVIKYIHHRLTISDQ